MSVLHHPAQVSDNSNGSTLADPDQLLDYRYPSSLHDTPVIPVPNRRPSPLCRTFNSTSLELLISTFNGRFKDERLARLFENSISQTLDNTIRWFSTDKNITETYIISGDITSEWLRDSTNQVNVYLPLIDSDKPLKQLILGVINLQAKFITEGTYCNGFNPPKESNIAIQSTPGVAQSASETPLASLLRKAELEIDEVSLHTDYERDFQRDLDTTSCNLGVDGLASFLTLSNRFHSVTNETTFVTPTWLKAVELSLQVFENESGATSVSIGSNTGKPDSSVPAVNEGARHPQAYTGLVGTRLRPSNEPVIFPYNVPVNAMISVQTSQLQKLLTSAPLSPPSLKRRAAAISQNINKALNVHAVTTHPIWGKIYAYELDGFGSTAIMDDAAIPSLLSLPYIGWESLNSTIFKTTRRLLTSPDGNPFFFNGTSGFGIGSSHTGADKIWPMSLISLLFSSESAEEIESIIQILIDSTQGYGVLHESFDAFKPEEFTRTWFAWVNSYFAEAILYLAEINPGTIFKDSQPILLTSQGNLAWYGGLRH
ncbi:hypothetical protein PSTT_02508 [Puccinia striiformis]|uniref:Glycoside hydrolase family 125 protein n=1 Tax=Puccinia striiformis TaxID=27350 RepID=A0A2S4VZF4_9BASI|nr:hypothetical protein PSTT_02508 [Puccinia striiformis]